MKRAFTLIEVLVVVAIIAVLVAILLPSMQSARESARSAMCSSNMHQGMMGSWMQDHLGPIDTTVRVNYGWATQSLKSGQGQTEIFNCPNDPNPMPMPAVFLRACSLKSAIINGTLQSVIDTERMIGSDAINSRMFDEGTKWMLDIQDQVMEDELYNPGSDNYDDPHGDLLIEYEKPAVGQKSTVGTAKKGMASYRHDLITYRGEVLFTEINSKTPPKSFPLLWMSYGANASTGLKNMKGNPAMIVEGRKLGIFPETLGDYKHDILPWALRFRHGGKAKEDYLAGKDYARGRRIGQGIYSRPTANDDKYVPNQRMNVGFVDGSVQTLGFWEIFDYSAAAPAEKRYIPKRKIWFGSRGIAPNF